MAEAPEISFQGRRTEGGGDVDDRPTNCWQTHDGWSALGGGEAVATDPDPPAGGAPWAATKQRRGGGDGEGGARGSAARGLEERGPGRARGESGGAECGAAAEGRGSAAPSWRRRGARVGGARGPEEREPRARAAAPSARRRKRGAGAGVGGGGSCA